jgi:hypothetical protein
MTLEVNETDLQAVLSTAQNTTSRGHLKTSEVLRKVYTRGRGLFRGWWGPVGPKFYFDQMAEPWLLVREQTISTERPPVGEI